MFFDSVKKYTKYLAILRNKKREKFYILSAKMHLVLVFLVKLKRKNILFAKMHFCTQNVRKNKNAFHFDKVKMLVQQKD